MTRARPPGGELELVITALAAGGDGLGRDAGGRVTFVPRAAPGDRVRARLVHETASFARAALVEVLAAGADRAPSACPHFDAGCGGCAWQHVARPAQLAAKQAIASTALRRLEGLAIHPIEDPAPALGWRRRARFHVAGGRTGLFALGSHRVLPIASCPQLVPALDAARAAAAGATPPDGELALVGDAAGAIAVGVERPWRGADRLVGRAGIAGVEVAGSAHGDPVIELEPGLWVGPRDFAQASRAGNAALRARVVAAVGAPPAAPHGSAHLLELFAGAGNLTRALVAAGWDVDASDVEPPRRAVPWRFARATAADALAAAASAGAAPAAVVLDPPRTGALDAMEGIARLAPGVVVYVSCDPATLARDAARLVAAGYRATDAWPLDLMPQTAHVEVVLRLERGAPR